jgi:DNA polymerase III sliding clamp (beta) subunit (PCNA family)
MKRNEMLTAVKRVSRVANEKTTLPVLATLRIGDGQIVGSNLRTTIVHPFACDVSACVSAHKFGASLASLEGEDVNLKPIDSGITVSNGKRRHFKMQTMAFEEFPSIDSVDGKTHDIDPAWFAHAIRSVRTAVYNQADRPNQCGVALCFGDKPGAAATDGNRCHIRGQFSRDNVIVSNDSIPAVIDLLEASEMVRVTVSTTKVSFGGIYTVIAARVDGMFPPVDNIIRYADCPFHGSINREAFVSAIQACAIACGTAMNITAHFAHGELSLHALNSDDAMESHDHVVCDFDDETENIGFGADYLLDAAKGTEAETLTIDCGGPLDPLYLRADDYVAAIMPRRI